MNEDKYNQITKLIEKIDEAQIELLQNIDSKNPAFKYVVEILMLSQEASSELIELFGAAKLSRANADGNLLRIKELSK